MGREVKITNTQNILLGNLTKMIENSIGVDSYLITEQEVADKYKVSVEEIILLEKKAIPIEIDEKNVKIRRAKILKNLYEKGLSFYDENKGETKSDFTDALIVNNEGKLLFLKRNVNDNLFPGVYCLPGGHLEKSLSEERNVKKEIKEETGLDVLECKFVAVKSINNGKNKIYYFFCTLPFDYEIVLNEREHSNYIWMSLADIKNEPEENFILDTKKYLLDHILEPKK
ncbi:hypothetical protein SJC03_204 [Bacteroides phage SJC03]|nr:hypothetical protein SJC03_204 [Bacteroides phage SJC03]